MSPEAFTATVFSSAFKAPVYSPNAADAYGANASPKRETVLLKKSLCSSCTYGTKKNYRCCIGPGSIRLHHCKHYQKAPTEAPA